MNWNNSYYHNKDLVAKSNLNQVTDEKLTLKNLAEAAYMQQNEYFNYILKQITKPIFKIFSINDPIKYIHTSVAETYELALMF